MWCALSNTADFEHTHTHPTVYKLVPAPKWGPPRMLESICVPVSLYTNTHTHAQGTRGTTTHGGGGARTRRSGGTVPERWEEACVLCMRRTHSSGLSRTAPDNGLRFVRNKSNCVSEKIARALVHTLAVLERVCVCARVCACNSRAVSRACVCVCARACVEHMCTGEFNTHTEPSPSHREPSCILYSGTYIHCRPCMYGENRIWEYNVHMCEQCVLAE